MKGLVTVVGARPQFVKAGIVSEALRAAGIPEVLVHTGQHYDDKMSGVFFRELIGREAHINLGVGSGPHGRQTGEMLARLEDVMLRERPRLVLVYGDTNSTLAGALAAVKLQIPVAHVEAGARTLDLNMPEEVNRRVTDVVSTLRFCATRSSCENLRREGMAGGAVLTGDVMLDVFLRNRDAARERVKLLGEIGVTPGDYVLATFHRPSNVDDPVALGQILSALRLMARDVVFPVHPRTRRSLDQLDGASRENPRVRFIDPVGYLDLLCLLLFSAGVLTDSGGVQREAYFAGRPCTTVLDDTLWPETVEEGWNRVVPPRADAIVEATGRSGVPPTERRAFGDGRAAQRIVVELARYLNRPGEAGA